MDMGNYDKNNHINEMVAMVFMFIVSKFAAYPGAKPLIAGNRVRFIILTTILASYPDNKSV